MFVCAIRDLCWNPSHLIRLTCINKAGTSEISFVLTTRESVKRDKELCEFEPMDYSIFFSLTELHRKVMSFSDFHFNISFDLVVFIHLFISSFELWRVTSAYMYWQFIQIILDEVNIYKSARKNNKPLNRITPPWTNLRWGQNQNRRWRQQSKIKWHESIFAIIKRKTSSWMCKLANTNEATNRLFCYCTKTYIHILTHSGMRESVQQI